MEDTERPAGEEAEVLRAELEDWRNQLQRVTTWVTASTTVVVLFIASIAAYGGYLFGRAESDVRTVERIGDPRMHMQISVPGGEATVYVHPVRQTADSLDLVPDITFTMELPNALAALPADAFCGATQALTLCGPHLVRLGPDSTAYVMEPEAHRLDNAEGR